MTVPLVLGLGEALMKGCVNIVVAASLSNGSHLCGCSVHSALSVIHTKLTRDYNITGGVN